MSFVRKGRLAVNAFLVVFLSLLFLTAVTDAHQWPFMAYDMYARDPGSLRFIGQATDGGAVDIRADEYFSSFNGHFFDFCLLEFYRNDPARFSEILHALRERYNRSATHPVQSVRVVLRQNGADQILGDYL